MPALATPATSAVVADSSDPHADSNSTPAIGGSIRTAGIARLRPRNGTILQIAKE
jgi:hypothetical protein